MTNLKLPFTFLFLLGASTIFAQGFTDGFMKAKGQGTVALTYSHERAETYFFGDQEQFIDLTSRSVSAYVAYGISDRFDLIATLPYITNDSLNSAFQDATVAIKYQNGKRDFDTGRFRTMTIIGFQFPASDYPTTTAQPIGIRATSFVFRLLGQYENYNGFFVNGQTGVDFRFFPEQQFGMPFIIRTGYGNSKWYADAWLDYFRSFDNSTDQSVFGGAGSRWLKTGATVYKPLGKKFGIFVGGAYILTGRNVSKSWRANVGLVWNWDPKVRS